MFFSTLCFPTVYLPSWIVVPACGCMALFWFTLVLKIEKWSTCFRVLIDRKCFSSQVEFTYEFPRWLQQSSSGELKPTHHRRGGKVSLWTVDLFWSEFFRLEPEAWFASSPQDESWPLGRRGEADRAAASWILMLHFRSPLLAPPPHPLCSACVFICLFLFSIFFPPLFFSPLPLLLTVLFLLLRSSLSLPSLPLHVLLLLRALASFRLPVTHAASALILPEICLFTIYFKATPTHTHLTKTGNYRQVSSAS